LLRDLAARGVRLECSNFLAELLKHAEEAGAPGGSQP
jgi:hypothetical protein